ncbi:MAG: hypothetical protein FJ217_04905 [Ignavibacteria bacterium]|nr:hypothetical protein [Ignavibacteria bacterium]
MLARLKEFIVVCVHGGQPMVEADLAAIRERIVASKPDYWEETEPGIFLAFFLIRRGGRTSSLKLTASVGSLKKPGTAFYNIGIAKSVGELVTERTWYGKIISCPFGDAVNKALKLAREAAQK